MFDHASGTRLAEIASSAIQEMIDPEATSSPPVRTDSTTPAIVYVTLWHRGQARAVGASHHLPLEQGVRHAARCALDIPIDGRLLRLDELADVTIEVRVRGPAHAVDNETAQAERLQRGDSGLSLHLDGGWFDLSPEDSRTGPGATARARLVARASLTGKPVVQLAWYVSEWARLTTHAGRCHRLHESRVQVPWQASVESCRDAAEAAAKRLLADQDVTGKYTYAYFPLEDRASNEDYSLVRLAGTIYSMTLIASLAAVPVRSRYAASAGQALDFLFRSLVRLRWLEHGLFVANGPFGADRYEGKLGTTALALLALQFGAFRDRHAAVRRGLIETVLALQHPDGAFVCTVPVTERLPNHRYKSGQNYFPGEALLALAYELAHADDDRIADAMLRAFPFYRAHFRTAPHTAFVLWQVSAWTLFRRLLDARPALTTRCAEHGVTREDIEDFVYAQADFILDYQHTRETAPRPEFIGGFPRSGAPGSVSSCYLEAVIRAAQLAHECNDSRRFARYRQASLDGLAFLRRLQIKSEESYRFADPARAIGGIPARLDSMQLRNDRDQHAITAFLAAAECPFLFRGP